MSTIVRMFKRAFILTRPPRRAKAHLSSGKAARRRTARRIRSAMSVRAGELVSRQCLEVRLQCPEKTNPEDFFNILLGRNVWAR